MCGIAGIFNINRSASTHDFRGNALRMSQKLRHRGPDWSGLYESDRAILAHERLAIVDPESGGQPLKSSDGSLILAVNGEIYNHRELRSTLASTYDFQTNSDCEVILALYKEYGTQFLEQLNGIFAFALYDKRRDAYLIARDHLGIVPLYIGTDDAGCRYISSELKAMEGLCSEYEPFPPGHYFYSENQCFKQWYQRDWTDYNSVCSNTSAPKHLRIALEEAVRRQLMSDVPYGTLLSGGLDSSIISAIAKKFSSKRIEEDSRTAAWYPQLHTFAIGLKQSPDLPAARLAAEHIGAIHHEIHYTMQEGIDALRDVIYHIETYDVTTVRASAPMYLLARVIKSMGIKMVLSGEGADEVFGGYLYFHKAPSPAAFHEETVRKLRKLYLYDCLRANKSLAAWGVEGRVPFLDKAFLDVAMTLNPADKMAANGRMEKWILRKACEDLLPASIAWRQKEQFSDGVGYGWIDGLRAMAARLVSDKMMLGASERFPINPPRNKEEYYYRSIFEEHFPSRSAALSVPSVPSVACSTAEALAWDASFRGKNEPSGRAVCGVHENSL